MSTQYSKAISDAIYQYLSELEWEFSFNRHSGFFGFKYKLRNEPHDLELLITTHDTYYIVYGLCPTRVEPGDCQTMLRVSEFMHRVNWLLKCGNWNIDLDSGHINYKVCFECAGLDAPSSDMICSAICCVLAMFERYGSGISDIIAGSKDVQAVIDSCNNKEMDFDQHH